MSGSKGALIRFANPTARCFEDKSLLIETAKGLAQALIVYFELISHGGSSQSFVFMG